MFIRRISKIFPDKYSANIGFNHRLFLPEGGFHLFDGVFLGVFGDVDVGLHGLVVAVAGPFHHDLRRDATGEGQADEGAAAGVGAQHLVLGKGLLDTLAGTEAYTGDGIVESAELAQVLQIVIHLLVGNHRQGVVPNGLQVLVLFEYGFGIVIEVNGQAVVGLLGGDAAPQ